MIVNCMRSIEIEVKNQEDRFTERIIAAGIAVMLSLCMRYYEQQHNTPKDAGEAIVTRLNKLLADYTSGDRTTLSGMPTVASLAEALHISSNYLGDVVRKKLGRSAQQHIRHEIVQEAKRQLRYSETPISEISYSLGFKYPHHLTRVFKREEGITPNQYRVQLGFRN